MDETMTNANRGAGHRFAHVGQFVKLPLDKFAACPTPFGSKDDHPQIDIIPIYLGDIFKPRRFRAGFTESKKFVPDI